MKKIAATALVGLAMASSAAYAADLFGTAPALSVPESASPTAEVGSNWYIRGDIGVGWEDSPTVVPSAGLIPPVLFDTPGTGVAYTNTPSGQIARGFNLNSQNAQFDLGFGYRVNDYLRVDGTWSFWRGAALGYSQSSLCPATTTAVSNMIVPAGGGAPAAVPAGYLWEPAACNGQLNARQFNNLGLASAYVDLGNFWGVTPYIGAGAGLNANTITGSATFINTNNGAPFSGNTAAGAPPLRWVTQTGIDANGNPVYTTLTHQPQVAFGPQNWNHSFTSTRFSVAGALMAGFSYPLSPSAMLDIGYRYISADLFGSVKNTAQQVHIGVRYMAD